MTTAFPSASAIVLLAALAFGYLCGSIPFGLLLTKAFGAGDLRSIGSGNIGATNVLRTGRKDLAVATMLLDALKGTLAVVVASRFGAEASMAAGLGAILGHLFPAWLQFRGGKAVATFLGVALGLDWRAALVFALVWLAVAFASKYSSLASLLATVAPPIAFFALGHADFGVLTIVLTILIWWKHRENIARLRAGTESRIGQKG